MGTYVHIRLWVLYPFHLYVSASLPKTRNQNRMERMMRIVSSHHVCMYGRMYVCMEGKA